MVTYLAIDGSVQEESDALTARHFKVRFDLAPAVEVDVDETGTGGWAISRLQRGMRIHYGEIATRDFAFFRSGSHHSYNHFHEAVWDAIKPAGRTTT
ncbi:hypothetical protein [Microbacterium oleivorans]|uniref:Uncharacterized protein n=1 Tax=Microbacterium oleivorans TaxID=273677 RepID=A0A177KFL5_9MICO|nr:hypothetical protein [Microbacterium oleivorans]OAH51371.1 hypothetical protein AYL44_03650 [Microbacterium oleivorans]